MGLKISFFKTPKHRVFHYEPIYYDERKEHREELIEEIKKEKALREGKEYVNEKYIPGRNIRGKMRNFTENNSRHDMKASTTRIISLVSLVVLFILIYYFATYFGWFLSLVK